MYTRNGKSAPPWRNAGGSSHADKVRVRLAAFSATVPVSLAVIDNARSRINDAKHEDSYLANQSDYDDLTAAIDQFWQDLENQEEFRI
jgi:hypothetical protein